MDNEIVYLASITRDGKSWLAEGDIDGEIMRVTLWPEHKRVIDKAGYEVAWTSPSKIVVGIPVLLVEDNGRRRVAAVLKCGTADDWIEVDQKQKQQGYLQDEYMGSSGNINVR